ncbi:hypothetical protein D3C84_1035180 [compost metagenome]
MHHGSGSSLCFLKGTSWSIRLTQRINWISSGCVGWGLRTISLLRSIKSSIEPENVGREELRLPPSA